MKGYLEDKEFGRIYVELRRGMTSVRFTYHPDGHLLMRAPLGTTVIGLERMIDVHREALRQLPRPQVPELRVGQVIECFRCRFVIEGTGVRPGFVRTRWDDEDTLHVMCHPGDSLDDVSFKRFVSERISVAMEYIAGVKLLPYAQEVAAGLDVKPAGLQVGRGMRKLGHCTSRNVIQLSRNLMFMPEPLVRYIICHELAHITHKNHSPQFHALCNQYCNGQEKELEGLLRRFRFPIMK